MWSGRANRGRPDPKIRRPRGQGRGGVNAGCGFGKNGLERLQGRGLAGWAFHCGDFGELGAAAQGDADTQGSLCGPGKRLFQFGQIPTGQPTACRQIAFRNRGGVTTNSSNTFEPSASAMLKIPVLKGGV